jgi:hypothetical protein
MFASTDPKCTAAHVVRGQSLEALLQSLHLRPADLGLHQKNHGIHGYPNHKIWYFNGILMGLNGILWYFNGI